MRRHLEPSPGRLLALAAACAALVLGLSACSDGVSHPPLRDTGGGGRDADAATDPSPDPDAAPDVAPDVAPDPEPDPDLDAEDDAEDAEDADAGDLGDADADADADEPAPEFQLVYAPNPDVVVGITDLMGVHATSERLYVTGLWDDTARVSYFPRDALTLPWCLYDGLGWPTGLAENPATGEIWVADMAYGLFVIDPPVETGDCGCDAVVGVECPVQRIDIGGVNGLGGVAISDAGRIFVSGLDQVTLRHTIWEVVVEGETTTLDPRLAGPALGDAIGLHLDPGAEFLYVASSDGFVSAYRVMADTLGTGAVITRGDPGYPTDIAADGSYFYWATQDPFAYPETDRGGTVVRTTLDGFSSTVFGEGQLVWPAGVSSDGEDWFVVDRATGLWGYY